MTPSSSYTQIDLDALERHEMRGGSPDIVRLGLIEEVRALRFALSSSGLKEQNDALIQRLREAEALVEMNRETDHLIHLGDQARIAQLERIRVAADELAAWWKLTYRLAPEKHIADRLHAALAALDPPRRRASDVPENPRGVPK